jgi:hypothetical protein
VRPGGLDFESSQAARSSILQANRRKPNTSNNIRRLDLAQLVTNNSERIVQKWQKLA